MSVFDGGDEDIAWCPGCGNFSILNTLKAVLEELDKSPQMTVIASGIGQAAKIPQYMNANMFNGLHGRSLPVATGIKSSNPELTVICESGDGDMYGEGGNHFIHAIRRNPDITNIVHDNMVYGLTKGQASPTSQMGFKTLVQKDGVFEEPFNPLAVALALDAGFVARAYCGHMEKTKEILKKAIEYEGYALVDVLQPCVTFNKVNTYQWFEENTYYLGEDHDTGDRVNAFEKATAEGKLGLGVFYVNSDKTPFWKNQTGYARVKTPLYKREVDKQKLSKLIEKVGGI